MPYNILIFKIEEEVLIQEIISVIDSNCLNIQMVNEFFKIFEQYFLYPSQIINSLCSRQLFYLDKQHFVKAKKLRFKGNLKIAKNIKKLKIDKNIYSVFEKVMETVLNFEIIDQKMKILIIEQETSKKNTFIMFMLHCHIKQQPELKSLSPSSLDAKTV